MKHLKFMLLGSALMLSPICWSQQPSFSSSPADVVVRPPANGRAQRQMDILKVPQLKLEIWKEAEPAPWEQTLRPSSTKGISSTLVLQSPLMVYPPTGLSYTSLFAGQGTKEQEMRSFTQGLVDSLAPRQGCGKPQALIAAEYGELKGWQTRMSCQQSGEKFDTQLFIGMKVGYWPVMLQAQTLPGKLDHASEFIRRGWTNVRYLEKSK